MQLSPEVESVISTAIRQVQHHKHYQLMPEHILYAMVKYMNPDVAEPIRLELAAYLNTLAKVTGEPIMNIAGEIVTKANKYSTDEGKDVIEISHLFKALREYQIKSPTFLKTKSVMQEEPKFSFITDLTKEAAEGKHDPVIGREETIRSLIEVLSKKTKSNAILVGPPGVGKTAIVHAIAEKINRGMQSLSNYTLLSLDVGALLSGTGIRGSFEKRVSELLSYIKNKKVILFIDEIHMIINTKAEGSADAANMLKPALASGEVKVIGATTLDEYRLHVEKDPAFCRRFVKINVNEPDENASITMLRGLKKKIEAHHGVRIADKALVDAVVLAKRYITARRLPDSAIDLVDTACASAVVAVESEKPEVINIKERIWALGLEKASLEIDLERRRDKSDEQENNENNEKTINNVDNENSYEKTKTNLDIKKTINNKDIKPNTVLTTDTDKLKERINEINQEINQLELKMAPLIQEQEIHRHSLEETKIIKQKIEDFNSKLINYESLNDYKAAADIKNYILPNLQDKLEALQRVSTTQITENNIAEIVSRWTGIPVHRLGLEDRERLARLESRLGSVVFGQDEAVHEVASALVTSRAGFSDPNRPLAVFLFLGPTGVGKTELAKAVAFEMFDSKSLVTVDCSDYQTEISITKLVGVTAGYIGYNEGGRLTEPVRNKPFNLVLLDELDLAHKSLYGVLYQMFDEGRMVDGRGVEVDFKNTVIIMTSNLGYRNEWACADEEERKRNANKLLIQTMGPALYNRIDSVIHFNKLNPEVMANILNLQIREIQQRFYAKNITLLISDNAKTKILLNTMNEEFGARPLKKYMQREVVNRVAKYLVESGGSLNQGRVILDVRNDIFVVEGV